MEIKNQKETWEAISPSWNLFKNSQGPFFDISGFLRDKKGKILDLGCGSGRNFLAMPKSSEIYGLDFSESMLKYADVKAKELKINCFLNCSSADSLPFSDNFFDCAIYVATLHCIESEKKRKKSLEELYRVLKSKARVFISVWSRNHNRIKSKGKEQYIPWTVENKKYFRYYYVYDKEELESLLKEVGFKILKVKENDNIIVEAEK